MRAAAFGSIFWHLSRSGAATARKGSRARSAAAFPPAAIAILASLWGTAPAAYAANFTCSWNDATANWTVAADWSTCNSTFPNNSGGNTFDATIAQGNPTLTTTATLGSVTITSPGVWSIAGVGAATLTGDATNSGSLLLDTNSGDGGGSLTIGGTLNNTKTVQVGSVNLNAGAATTLTLGGLSNPSGASFSVLGSAAHPATLAFSSGGTGFTSNAGTFGLFDTTPLTLNTAFDNSGTFRLDGTSAVAVTGNYANSGSLLLDTNSGDGGGSLTIGGTLNNTKTVQVGSVNLNAGAATTLTLGGLSNPSGASFSVLGSAAHPATLAFSSGGTGFTSNAGTFGLFDTTPLTLNTAFDNSGTFRLDGTSAVTVTGNYANSGSLLLDTNSGDGGDSLTIGGTLNNTKTVQVGSVNLNAGAATTLTLGGLSNPSGASFSVLGSAAHPATLAFSSGGTGFTSNAGTFGLFDTTPLTLNTAFDNSGTFRLDGTSAVTVTGNYANSGSLLLDTNSGDGGGSLTIGGTLNNTKTVQVGSVNLNAGAATTLTLGGLSNPSGASFSVLGSAAHPATLAFSSGGTGFTSNAGTFGLFDTTPLTLNTAFDNSGTFRLDGTSAVTVTGNYANSGSLLLDTNSGDGGGSLTIGGTLNNTKTVQVGSVNLNAGAATTLTLGGLSNPSGASFSVLGSAAHPATLAFSSGGTGFTSNAGTFGLFDTTPLTLNTAFDNSGTFRLDGTSAVTVTGNYANSGSLLLDTNSGDGGGSLTIGGTLNNTKTVQVGSVNLNAGAATTLTLGGLSNPSGASFSVLGSAAHPATLAFSSGGTGFTSNAGTFGLFDTTPLTLNTAFDNSGTFRLDGTSAVTVTGNYANSGSLLLDTNSGDGGGSLTIGGTLNNTKTVQVGSVNLNAGAATTLTLGGLSNPSGASFSVLGSAAHPATLAFSSGGTGFTSNAGTFGLFDTTPLTLNTAFDNSGTFRLDGTSAVTVTGNYANSGSLLLDTNSGDGGGSLTIGGTLNNTKTVQVGSVNLNAGAATTLTLGGLSNASTGTLSVFGSGANQARVNITVGPATNAGTLTLQENVSLVTGSGVGLTNSGTFSVDTNSGTGASTASIGGTFGNSGTLNVGNTSLSAPTTVTAAGLSNTGTMNLAGNTNNSANQAKVTVNGQATNSGTVNIPIATSVSVTGAGNAYTQTAGFTNLSGGVLAAPNTNITGGTLRGMGTVTGATTISGSGTIQALNLANSNLAAVLTIDGNYFQSAGTFAELLHGTGIQLDKVAVTSGHTVNLSGGNLQLSGVTFALGQVFSNIMTFQPGELTGTFATIQGGGNGTFVDIGNGLRLTAIYDNVGGDISIEVGPTVIVPGKIWIDATGNWTTNTAKWSPVGAPVATDDVTIGSTNNGNVTLDNTTTIKSLTINTSNALTNTTGTTLTVTTNVSNSGNLTLAGSLSAGGAVTNNSGATLAMQGGTLSAPSFSNSGTTSGFGTIAPAITNSGLVQASGGTLTAQKGIQGATGNITVNPSATLDLSQSTTGSSAASLAVNGNLNLGSQNLTVSTTYTNANFGAGNSFDKRANVTGAGQIQAAGNVAQAVTGAQVTNGTSSTPTLALGNLHVGGSTSATYSIANNGTTGPSLIGAIQTNVNGGHITDPALSGGGVTAQNFGPIATGTSTTAFTVTYAPTTAGGLSGQAVHLANNFGNVGEQTMSITGAAYNLASSNTIVPINFGVLHVGDPTATRALTIMNTAPAGAFSEGLDSSFGAYSNNGGTLTPGFGGSIINLPAGMTNSTSMTASLSTAAAGSVNGNVTVHQASNGTISGLPNTALPDQTPAVTGSVITGTITNLAEPQINNSPITFAARTGDVVGTKGVSITNAAPASAFTEGLIGNVTGTTGTGITAAGGFGPPTANPELAGQQTNATFIQVGIDASTAGVKAGNAVIAFKSDGTPFGGVVTDLDPGNVAVSGKVYTPAVANVLTTSPIDFGIVHVGDPTQSKSVTVQNGATATALNDGLVGTISAGGPPFSGSGSIAPPGLAPGASSSALQVNLATSTAGIFTGTANLALASHDADLTDLALGTSPLSLNAQVNRFAALSFLKQGGDGALSDSFVLDFGDVLQGSGTLEALLAMLNNNPIADQAFTDLLSTDGDGSIGPFRLSGCSVKDLLGGMSQPGCDVFFDTSVFGDFREVFSFPVESSNTNGYDQVIGNVTLTIEGSVGQVTPTPEPGTMTLLGSGLGMLFFVVRRRRRMA